MHVISTHISYRLGFPRVLISDQGREFVNHVVDDICKILAIDHRMSAAYHPQTNGLTERQVHVQNSLMSQNGDRLIASMC